MRPRPSPLLTRMFDAPTWLYERGWGWTLGRRFCAVEHVGRKTGRVLTTILEVVDRDPATEEIVVVSAYGATANWYRNIRERPATRIRTGRAAYRPEQRFLDPDEARAVAQRFARNHRIEARIGPHVMATIGTVPPGTATNAVEMFAAFPQVAFRPVKEPLL